MPKKGLKITAPPEGGTASEKQPQIGPALGYLKSSEHGRGILDFIDQKKIRFNYAGSLPDSIGAAYNPDTNEIWLPKNAQKMNPVKLADSIGHEGYHAEQRIAQGMEGSIEMEQGANFMDRVIYYEMKKAGAPPLPKGDPTEENYQRFVSQAKTLDLKGFNADIAGLYGQEREKRLRSISDSHSAPVGAMLRVSLVGVDANFLNDYETIDYQEGKLWNLLRRKALEKTRQEHAVEQQWELQWMKDHQRELQGTVHQPAAGRNP